MLRNVLLATTAALALAACSQTRTQTTGADQNPVTQNPDVNAPVDQQPGAGNPGTRNPSAAPGSMDGGFGTNGILLAPLPPALANGYPPHHAIPDDQGRIIVTGSNGNQGGLDLAVARYLPNGSLDTSFGNGGASIVAYRPPQGGPGSSTAGYASLPLADGSLLSYGHDEQVPYQGEALYHFTANGQQDTSYAWDTAVGHTTDLARQPDGKVLIGLWRWADKTIRVARLLADGKLDPSFGSNGIAEIDIVPNDSVTSETQLKVSADRNGRVLATAVTSDGTMMHRYVLRLTPNGQRDSTFSGDGITEVTFAGEPYYRGFSLAVDSQGRALIGAVLSSKDPSNPNALRIGVERLTASGEPDSSFGTSGLAVPQAAAGPFTVTPDVALAVDAADRPLIASATIPPSADHHAALVAIRLEAGGAVDASFGSGGLVVVPGGSDAFISTVTLDASGRITVTGFTASGGLWQLLAARLNL